MKEYAKSDTTGKTYCASDVIRIINVRQAVFYMKNGVKILDFYPSEDFKTGEDVMVFLVNKKDTQEVYQKWLGMRHE